MTVGELREKLDNWGDHVPVMIDSTGNNDPKLIDEIDDDTIDGELTVVISGTG
jgi:hypothetical protein